jgi:ubiquinone/menaquinone biosynthesis C-methylase UbiE
MKNSQRNSKHYSPTIFEHIFNQEVDPAFAKRSSYIINHLAQAKPAHVLDAGCGRGYYVKLISMLPSTKKVIGIDINSDYVRRAQAVVKHDANAEVKQGSIYTLPFKDATFDAVVCSEILEHLDDDSNALKEIYRVLKPQGIFLASVPHLHFPFLWDPLNWILMKFFNTHVNKDTWWLAGIWADHVRLYSEKKLHSKIKNAGFSIQDSQELIRWCWPFSHFFLYAIGKNLVERFGATGFDRFNFEQTKPLSQLLAAIMRFPSQLLDKTLPIKVSMNLVVMAQKK